MELYYKTMHHTIDFRDHAVLLLNPKLEGEIRTGRAWAYGAEFLVKLNLEDLSGWVSYTLSKARNKIPAVNQGEAYNAAYDRPNDVSVVLNYKITERLRFGANWIFMSGQPVTFPVGRYVILRKVLPVYSKRNEYRFEDYHRLDLSFTLSNREKSGKNLAFGVEPFGVQCLRPQKHMGDQFRPGGR